MKAFWMSLFWTVMFENTPAFPNVPASEITTAELVFTPLRRTQFLTVSFVTGVVPTEPIKRTLGVVALVFSIVRLRSVPPLFEPSMMTKLAPLSLMRAVVALPVILLVTPGAGLIVIVFVALEPALAMMIIGKTSPVDTGAVV